MLTPEAAREQLKKQQSDKFVQERLTRLTGIPETVRADARALFQLEEGTGKDVPIWQQRQEHQAKALAAYRAIPEETRQELIRTVMPELAPYILRALKNAERQPYTSGHTRKPFRAPWVPGLLDEVRMNVLSSLITELRNYPPDIEWIATWAGHAWPYRGAFVAPLLAAAIDENDAQGQKVFEILLASAKGEHEIGQMGRHVIGALVSSARTEGWEFVEKLLLAAQREEGLRQAILESIDEGHPDAYIRFLRIVLAHDLVRFSAVVRAVDVWFGFLWDAMSARKAKEIIEHALRFLESPELANQAIAAAKALPAPATTKTKGKKLTEPDEAVEPAYIALWSKAFQDVQAAIASATDLLNAAHPEVRFVATHLLGQLELTGKPAQAIAQMLSDPDERVAARALAHFHGGGYYGEATERKDLPDLFEQIEKLLERAPEKSVKLAPIVWPWMNFEWSKEAAGHALVHALCKRPASRLIPHLSHFSPDTRHAAARRLGASESWDDATRQTLFFLVGDPSSSVREEAMKHLVKCTILESEAQGLEELLTRKSADLRRGILTLLLSQSDEAALASADRLTKCTSGLQRVAGLEVLRQLSELKRSVSACQQRAMAYREQYPEPSADERTQLEALIRPQDEALTFDNCLGLIDPALRTRPVTPEPRNVEYTTPAAINLLEGLDELVHTHREKPFTPKNRRGESQEEQLLGNARWGFPRVDHENPKVEDLPFKEIWIPWFENRSADLRDGDGLELVRADWLVAQTRGGSIESAPEWFTQLTTAMCGNAPQLRYANVLNTLVDWLQALYPAKGVASFYLNGLENALTLISKDQLAATIKSRYSQGEDIIWRHYASPVGGWAALASTAAIHGTRDEIKRAYGLMRWMDEPIPGIPRQRVNLGLLLAAWVAGSAFDADVFDYFLGPRVQSRYSSASSELGRQCALKPSKELEEYPALKDVLNRCRSRVLDIELTRGETPTLVTDIAKSLRHSGGLDVLLRFLMVAEKDTFARGHNWGSLSKPVVFSHVIRATYPGDADSPAAFAGQIKDAKVSDERQIELAVYAPQWVEHVAESLQWPALPEAVWWIHAHTRDRGWTVDAELRERWKAQVSQRTPLDAEDLVDGAVDVAWFNRTYSAMGKKRWEAVYNAAKYAASGGGHKRAQLFADAMLGHVKSKELVTRITSKRHQDAVRALGLLPLPPDQEKAKKEMLGRYKTLQEFIRTSRQFGSQRQTSEKRAATIGMENLARTAGYPDPIRLQWAMEAHACADLAKGPVIQAMGEVTVSLSLDAEGAPDLTCTKKGKPLANIPPAVKKDPKVQELTERKTELKRSSSRMRGSLEQAMIRGDVFSGSELADLMANPLLAPQLVRLVFLGEGIAGYPVDGGRGLMDYAGKIEPVKKSESLRLVHPYDLLKTNHWTEWQRDCFARERVQPFKQIFRELYVPTKTELDAQNLSRRYAGHQVQPKQALALLGGRGWVTAPEEGVFKVFHELQMTAWLTFLQPFFTPADIEGLTLEGVGFTEKKRGHGAIPLKDIPPRIFSEVMRDLDLIVSVAHRGGVDPEASASTVQMRSALLAETLDLLSLKNVRIQDMHAFIKGQLAEYTIHLGSAVTHRQPGGALFIVPVHSQHRGRLFLPFADDDPKTAEVLSKVILLARDHEIKDPNLLAQIRC